MRIIRLHLYFHYSMTVCAVFCARPEHLAVAMAVTDLDTTDAADGDDAFDMVFSRKRITGCLMKEFASG